MHLKDVFFAYYVMTDFKEHLQLNLAYYVRTFLNRNYILTHTVWRRTIYSFIEGYISLNPKPLFLNPVFYSIHYHFYCLLRM